MTIAECAKDMKCSVQFLRCWIALDKCPFGTSIQNSSVRTYYINEERYKLWKKGQLK